MVRPSLMKLFTLANTILLLGLSQTNNCQYCIKLLHQPGLLLEGKKCEFLIFTGEALPCIKKKKSQNATVLPGKKRLNSTNLVFCSTDLEGGSEITPPAPNILNPRHIQHEISQVTVQSLVPKIFKKIIKPLIVLHVRNEL